MSDYMITREALDNFYAWVSEAQQLRLILTDLITELRARHPAGEWCCCGWCDRDKEAADRAEQRLREVQGE